MLGPVGPKCPNMVALGSELNRDNEKWMCGMPDVTPDSSSGSESCIMISIGSNGQWGFENGIRMCFPSGMCVAHMP